jgi:hypothetical protein
VSDHLPMPARATGLPTLLLADERFFELCSRAFGESRDAGKLPLFELRPTSRLGSSITTSSERYAQPAPRTTQRPRPVQLNTPHRPDPAKGLQDSLHP